MLRKVKYAMSTISVGVLLTMFGWFLKCFMTTLGTWTVVEKIWRTVARGRRNPRATVFWSSPRLRHSSLTVPQSSHEIIRNIFTGRFVHICKFMLAILWLPVVCTSDRYSSDLNTSLFNHIFKSAAIHWYSCCFLNLNLFQRDLYIEVWKTALP